MQAGDWCDSDAENGDSRAGLPKSPDAKDDKQNKGGAGVGEGELPGQKPRKKGGGSKDKCRCPGCNAWLFPQELAMNSRYCVACNRIKNVLYGAAKRKNKTDMLAREMANDTSCKKLFDRYRQQCGKDPKSALKPGVFLLEYEEELAATTRVLIDEEFCMMALREAKKHKGLTNKIKVAMVS